MKTTPVTLDDIGRSVWAVPPLALTESYDPNTRENRRLVRHIESGGVSTLLWGGNAQIQHWRPSRYAELLAMVEEIAADGTWVIPSAGPDWGKLVDEAHILRRTLFPTALLLPMPAHKTPAGVERGVRTFADIIARPATLYIREADYLAPETLGRLVEAGEVCAIKYAVPRPDFRDDPYLARILDHVPRGRIVSGFGELPAVPHLDAYRLAGFTAGCVCIAPRLSMRVLNALQTRDIAGADRLLAAIRPMEALREKFSPIRVIHEAVRLAGVADTGPLLPLLSNVEAEHHPAIRAAAQALLEAEAAPAA
jgi:dihydrodipicolinate synthase/N-acetylneuraminate lyase